MSRTRRPLVIKKPTRQEVIKQLVSDCAERMREIEGCTSQLYELIDRLLIELKQPAARVELY